MVMNTLKTAPINASVGFLEGRIVIRIYPNEYITNEEYTTLRVTSEKYGVFDFLIDNDDVERVKQYHWGVFHVYKPKHIKQLFYCSTSDRSLLSTHRLLHRFIMTTPKGKQTDHISGDTMDTRKQNLRICTALENGKNRSLCGLNKSGVKGVRWADKIPNPKWHAYIKNNDRFYSLGYYDDFESAVEARKQGEIRFQGEYSRDYGEVI